jgi:hypothetical protein
MAHVARRRVTQVTDGDEVDRLYIVLSAHRSAGTA